MSEENKKNGEAELTGGAAKPEEQSQEPIKGDADAQKQQPAAEAPKPTATEDQPRVQAQPASEPPKAAEAEQTANPAAAQAATGTAAEQPKAEAKAVLSDEDREAKVKAAAEARAARAAARAAASGDAPAAAQADAGASGEAPSAAPSDDDKEAKAKAAAEARAARAAARAKPAADENAGPKEPSPKQPMLDKAVAILKEQVGAEAVAESFVNEKDAHLPYIVIPPAHWAACARVLHDNEAFKLTYLRNVSGIDMETHLEVAYHLLSLDTKDEYCIKVKTDRTDASIPSVTPVWQTANWNEREIFDLFGIDFPGHPDLRRIMMPDDWVGHPLRKDYEAIDPEV